MNQYINHVTQIFRIFTPRRALPNNTSYYAFVLFLAQKEGVLSC